MQRYIERSSQTGLQTEPLLWFLQEVHRVLLYVIFDILKKFLAYTFNLFCGFSVLFFFASLPYVLQHLGALFILKSSQILNYNTWNIWIHFFNFA